MAEDAGVLYTGYGKQTKAKEDVVKHCVGGSSVFHHKVKIFALPRWIFRYIRYS